MTRLITLALIITSSIISQSHAAQIQVRGIDEELTKTMADLMKPRLEFIGKRPATDWRADDAAFFLRELLVKRGYAQSKVNWELPGNDVIMLRVDLGARFVIGKITNITDDPLSDQLVDDYFCELLTEGTFYQRKKAPFLEDYPQKGAANIENYLKSQGYWDTRVNIASINKKANGGVDIKLKINRGILHKILPPTYEGVSTQQMDQLLKKTAPFLGKSATSSNISSLNNAVHQHFRDLGYQFAELQISSQNTTGIKMNYSISTGNLYTVRRVVVRGNEKTVPSRFNRYKEPLVGETYKESAANEVTKKLLLTGAFESVRLIPQKINTAELDLILEVKEAKPRFVRAYGGFASFDGIVLGSSYTNQNFLNKLQTFTARSEISSRGLLGELSLTEPYFAGIPLSQTTRLYSLQRRFDGYKKNQTGLELAFKWQPTKSLTSRLYASLDYIALNSSNLTPDELGPSDYLNTRVGIEQTLDLRNNPVLPTKGFHTQGLLEFGTISGDASNSYFRTNLDASYRYILDNKKKNRLLFSFSTGAIFPSDSSDLPIDLRLFSGGADSIRSYGERELGLLSSSGDPLGGEAYWNASVEYIRPYNDLLSGVIFYDVGSIFSDANNYSFSSPNQAIGIGARIDLPVGPVRLEYGYNLNQKPGEPSGAFHFSIGAQF